MSITTPGPDDLDAVIDLIVAEQADVSRGTGYLGTTRDGIVEELGDLNPDWRTTLRVAGEDGRVVGAVVWDIDTELGRSWIFGPWVSGDEGAWSRWAPELVAAAIDSLAELSPAITDIELCGDVANQRLAALGADLGLKASEVNHVLVVDTAIAEGWPGDDARLRGVRADDVERLRPLHDAEFPRSYYTAERVVADGLAGEFVVVVAEQEGEFLGYASGRVQADGEGYLDFVAVPIEARGRGVGLGLVVGASRRIMALSPKGTVNLTVREDRLAARGLYARLGFRPDGSIVGYRSDVGADG
ncbi:MAG: GNAT family N-acetyltransferase [Micropruina sp.]